MLKTQTEKLLAIFVSLLSIAAIYWSYTSGWMVAYNDATAHLNTARRIVDNLTPGLVQIGSVWLPLLHILEMPFTMNFFLWQSGLAGAIVSGASFIIASIFLYKILFFVTKDKFAGIIGVLFLVSNPNLLYLQTAAMFEPLLIVTALAAVYFFMCWANENKGHDLIRAAFFIMLATLTRYDGWALFAASILYVFIVGLFFKRKGVSGTLIVYLSLAGFGIVLWFLYNLMIFNDPMYFASGEFSAKAQQDILEARGALPTKHNLPLSALTYSLAVVFNNGIIAVGIFLLGLVAYLVSKIRHIRYWAPFLLLVPYFFNILTLYLGQSVIWLPMIQPFFETYFNARYGILMLPAIAFFIGFLASHHILIKGAILILGVMQVVLFINPQVLPMYGKPIGVITLQDTVSSVNANTENASQFIHDHHEGGLILASSASADAFIFRAGIPLKNFITEGTGYYWKNSMSYPPRYATWIVHFKDKSDRVGKAVEKTPDVQKYYTKEYEDTTYEIWKKKT